ncbi:uncharacterized protein LOC117178093 [Belonocnema kinseyi]|uniref:uncharacterized protein LOC117178093 n=1 Tax=Belonocnema kinseyi TaxID=2817044 RepID=UPI00143D83F6|nr:uncharacterized protein LOC117178093 [Belonocnema kinseyi]
MSFLSDKQKCSVLSCPSTRREKYHQYPKCERIGCKWVRATANPELQKLTYKEVLEKRFVICFHYFWTEDYRFSTKVKKLKEGAVPSLLLPETPQNKPANEKIDVEEENLSPHASLNRSPFKEKFSPITFRHWISKSPGSVSLRESSLVRCAEYSDSSVPSTSKLLSSCVHSENAAVDVSLDIPEIGESSKEGENLQESTGPLTDEAINANVPTESVEIPRLKSRACKRLVWKKRDLDENTREMYEHVLEARRERDSYRKRSLRIKERRFASWDHIVTAYEIDVYSDFLERNVPDLTEQHVYIDKIKKIRVKLMMQVFSRKLFRFVDLLAKAGTINTKIGPLTVPPSGSNTAFVLQLMNALGDGMNGVSSGDNHPKRIPWPKGSYHSEFFKNARRQLKSMRFVHRETRKPIRTDIPCLQNLIDTLQGFQLLWKKLQSLGFKSFYTRNINQDPLENFFGQIKAHDFRSKKPTCYQFEDIFKSLLITSLTSKHSPGFNCEEDSGEFILSDCKSLLSGTQYLPNEMDDEEFVLEDESNDLDEGDEQRGIPKNINVHSHSGDLIKALQSRLPSVKSCPECVSAFQKESSLRNKGTAFRDMHLQAKRILSRIFTSNISQIKLGRTSESILQRRMNFNFFTCNNHKKEIFSMFKLICVRMSAQAILTHINRVLKGRILPKNPKRLCLPVKLAYNCFLKTIRKDKRPSNTIDLEKVGTKQTLQTKKVQCVAKKCKRNVTEVPNQSQTEKLGREVAIHIPEVESGVAEGEIDFSNVEFIFLEDE